MLKLMKKDIYRLLPPLILPNTGNMGMPLCLFAYGKMGLAIATAATNKENIESVVYLSLSG
jgi:hypothetical protein